MLRESPAERASHAADGAARSELDRVSGRFGTATAIASLRWVAIGAAALAVANCAGTPAAKRASSKNYGVKASPRVVAEGDPIPKGGGRAMTGKPYVVDGRTYAPHGGQGYDREGWASWYGSAFHGRLTANGEVFDRGSIAAAHPTLPLPSYVRVTNLSNDRSLIVRVNDRGPYERSRLIDLSEAAADALAFKRRGTTRVRVEYVGRASVNGSDDTKLLATLTTDGAPAALGRPERPVMVASRPEPDEDELRPVRPSVRVAAAPSPPRKPLEVPELPRIRTAEASSATPDARPARRPERPVSSPRAPVAEPEDAEPLPILPTSRSEPVGIY